MDGTAIAESIGLDEVEKINETVSVEVVLGLDKLIQTAK